MSIPRLEKRQNTANIWMTAHGLHISSENNELSCGADDILMAGRREDNMRWHRLLHCEVQVNMMEGIAADRNTGASESVYIYWCSFVVRHRLTHQYLTRRPGWPHSI